jgi:putative ubiquitin-RnfH superfamily antitoxin RatB of RatAB toxin-antitoxin module
MIVTVVCAFPGRHRALRVDVSPGATIGEAIEASGLLQLEPELQGRRVDAGVWNRRCSLGDPVRDGDRIEVYRPLTVDPKEARRIRAAVRRRRSSGTV